MAYALLTAFGRENPAQCMAALLGGYSSLIPLTSDEIDCLYYLVCARLSISISIGAYSIAQDPANDYLKLHAQPARDMLRGLMEELDAGHLREMFYRLNARLSATATLLEESKLYEC